MVGLIITLISLALMAIMLVAALFNLGDSFTSGSDKAYHARLQNEANQIVIAVEMYIAQNGGKVPESVSVLVDENYLKSESGGIKEFRDVDGVSTQSDWEYGFDNFVTKSVESTQQCANVNKAAGGSGDVADVPLCSDAYDYKNPCCTFTVTP